MSTTATNYDDIVPDPTLSLPPVEPSTGLAVVPEPRVDDPVAAADSLSERIEVYARQAQELGDLARQQMRAEQQRHVAAYAALKTMADHLDEQVGQLAEIAQHTHEIEKEQY